MPDPVSIAVLVVAVPVAVGWIGLWGGFVYTVVKNSRRRVSDRMDGGYSI